MTKKELYDWIKRRLGYPMVRVELHESQIEDHINKARSEYLKWASGSATEEIFFTIALSAGVGEYDLPSGVNEIITVNEIDTSVHGINTLFSLENYLYNSGILGFLDNLGSYSLIDYHMALEFIDLLDRYTPNYYTWRHDKFTNKLKIVPFPDESSQVGYLLVRSYMLQGTDANSTSIPENVYNMMWDNVWVQDYSLALAKETLGLIRRKFASFTSIGNEGIALDGDSLISEGREEKERLEEKLRLEESESLGFILVG